MLHAHVVEALPAEPFISVQMSEAPSTSLPQVVRVLSPKRAVIVGDPTPALREAWLQLLPAGRVTLLPTEWVSDGWDKNKGVRCGVTLYAANRFYSNFRKIGGCFDQVRHEEDERSDDGIIHRYTFIVTMRADLYLDRPMPRLAHLSTSAISVPFCNPANQQSARNPRCGAYEGGDAIGRGRSSCDVATDWLAIVPRQHAPAYFSAYMALHFNSSCAMFREASRDMCHCHGGDKFPQECVLSNHLHTNHAPYERLSLGVLAVARSVEMRGERTQPHVTSNLVIDVNGISASKCMPGAAPRYSPCPSTCQMHSGGTHHCHMAVINVSESVGAADRRTGKHDDASR